MKNIIRIFAVVLAMAVCFSSLSVSAAVEGTNVTNREDLGEFEELSCNVTANVIAVSGKVQEPTVITLWMQEDATLNTIVLRQFATDGEGGFSKKYILNPEYYAEDGSNGATLKISGLGYDTYVISGIELYSKDELTAPVNDFAAISDKDDFADFFGNEGYMSVLGIEESYTDEELKILFGFYQNLSFTGDESLQQIVNVISELVNKLEKQKFLVESVSAAAISGDTDEIGSLLKSAIYAEVMFELDHANILKENEMWARMAKPDGYASMAEIESAYIAARDAQLEAEKETGGPATSDREKNFKAEWKISTVANLVTISGAHQDEAETNVIFHVSGLEKGISNSPADTIGALQIKTDKKGKFTAEIPLNTERFGGEVTAVFRISAPNTNVHQFYIPLYSQDAVDEMIEVFKDIDDVDQLKEFISEYREMLQISGSYTEEKYNTMFALYEEKSADYQEFDRASDILRAIGELTETTSEVLRFIDAINLAAKSGQWGLMQSTIKTDFKELGEKSSTYKELLEETNDVDEVESIKGLYTRMLKKKYKSIEDVLDEFLTAKENQIKAEVPVKVPTGGGSGGGGGFGKIESTVFGEEYFEEEIIPEATPDELPTEPFTDLKGYEWAESAISTLRRNGIIRGDGNGQYRPGSNMTREEYLSVLLKTYGIEIKSGSVPFSDVESGAWYCDTVATAYALGITKGMGDGTFGIGKNITRADMVVLAARLSKSLGIDIPQVEVAVIFEDYAYIPDYAYESVVAFQQANFINGDTNGYFNPLNPTTRAEAAVFFGNIFEYMN